MIVRFFCFLFLLSNIAHGQNNFFDINNYETAKQFPEQYDVLILKGEVYKKFESLEKKFLNVNKIILTDVNNLILAESFVDFSNLKELIIVNSNGIYLKKNIDIINKLNQLSSLEITNCKLECLPKNFITLNKTAIIRISLSNNMIKNLPSNIDKLEVKNIDLSYNPIQSKDLRFLSKNDYIEELFLDYCDINNFPVVLNKMKRLKLLSLSYNKIKKLDDVYDNFKFLELLTLTGNPLDSAKAKFIDNQSHLIIDYIK